LAPTARKTNYDYTKGLLHDIISVIIEEKTKLFVCAVGVPPPDVVERLHKAGIICMNVSSDMPLGFTFGLMGCSDGRAP